MMCAYHDVFVRFWIAPFFFFSTWIDDGVTGDQPLKTASRWIISQSIIVQFRSWSPFRVSVFRFFAGSTAQHSTRRPESTVNSIRTELWSAEQTLQNFKILCCTTTSRVKSQDSNIDTAPLWLSSALLSTWQFAKWLTWNVRFATVNLHTLVSAFLLSYLVATLFVDVVWYLKWVIRIV